MPVENYWISDVREFHEIAKIPLRKRPSLATLEERQLAENLINEEHEELLRASQTEDLVGIADGIVDSIVVLIRYALVLGLPLDDLWDEVHRSNMSKFDHPTGRYAIFREDGKILKGERYRKPALGTIILEARQRD